MKKYLKGNLNSCIVRGRYFIESFYNWNSNGSFQIYSNIERGKIFYSVDADWYSYPEEFDTLKEACEFVICNMSHSHPNYEVLVQELEELAEVV